MFDLESHLDQMLKIALELTDDEHQPESMTPTQIEWLGTIEPNIHGLQSLISFIYQFDSPHKAIRQMSHEWRGPITSMECYVGILLEGGFGELTIEQHNKLHQLRSLVHELRDWSNQSFTSHKEE